MRRDLFWLYARILRLTLLMEPCRGADGSDLNDTVRELVVTDAELVWC